MYVRDLAGRIPETTVVAVADIDRTLADRIAEQFDVPKAYGSAHELIADHDVDAVVVVSPTHTHREIVVAAAWSKKPTFCEKPPALSLAECAAMSDAVNKSGTFFQMGFMRRFDPGYAAAKAEDCPGRDWQTAGVQIDVALIRSARASTMRIRRAVAASWSTWASTISISPAGSWETSSIRVSGRWGARVSRNGGDRRHRQRDCDARVSPTDVSGAIDLTRNGVYGYDISTDLLGDAGTVRVGYLRETPIVTMTKNNIAHDTVPDIHGTVRARVHAAVTEFCPECLAGSRDRAIVISDGVEALRIALAATAACRTGQPVRVDSIQ